MDTGKNDTNINDLKSVATIFTAACGDYLRSHKDVDPQTRQILAQIFSEAGKRLSRSHPGLNLDDEKTMTLANIPLEWKSARAA